MRPLTRALGAALPRLHAARGQRAVVAVDVGLDADAREEVLQDAHVPSAHSLAEIAVAQGELGGLRLRGGEQWYDGPGHGQGSRERTTARQDDPFLQPPTGLAVGLARKDSRYAAWSRRFAPGPGFPGPHCFGSPAPMRPPGRMGLGVMSRFEARHSSGAPAASVRGRDGSPRGRTRQARRRDRRPGAAVRGRRPRRLRRQRRRPAAPRGRQAGPAGVEVRARARADRPRAGRRPAGDPRLHAARGAVARRPRPRRRRRRLPDRRPARAARARGRRAPASA